MERLATYKFNDLNDTGIDKMPVGAQGVVEQAGNLTRFVKGVESTTLTSSSTIGDYLENNKSEYHEDVLYQSNNFTNVGTIRQLHVISHKETSVADQDTITLTYSVHFAVTIYIDGLMLNINDYIATSGTSIVLNNTLVVGQEIIVLYTPAKYTNFENRFINMEVQNELDLSKKCHVLNINPEGTILITGYLKSIYKFEITNPWDISSCVLTDTITSPLADSWGYWKINDTGTQIIAINSATDAGNGKVHGTSFGKVFGLGTAWDITTIDFNTQLSTIYNVNSADSYLSNIYSSSYIPGLLIGQKLANNKILTIRLDAKDSSVSRVYLCITDITGDDFTTLTTPDKADNTTTLLLGEVGFINDGSPDHYNTRIEQAALSNIYGDGEYIEYPTFSLSTHAFIWRRGRMTTPYDLSTLVSVDDMVTDIPYSSHQGIFRPDKSSYINFNGSVLKLLQHNPSLPIDNA